MIQFPFGSNMDKLSGDIEAAVNKLNLPANAKVNVQRLSINAQPIDQAAIFSGSGDPQALAKKLEGEVVPDMKSLTASVPSL
ncbi:hypothetical protein [Cohnella nanjingensis]|uniref:Efflux RND transporter permease subunit n=1 Tax=Cohnella nanjingensis TaxID=1387779 RepID=A0A7X0RWA4_9BACL|nr:hypothetical protein [Cohnella nanjingensis]MBB6673530.1 hypothetical protein [Cohnella nanjingensis]